MRRSLRWFLIGVLVLDVAVAATLLTGSLSTVRAVGTQAAVRTADDDAPTTDALQLLARQLAERAEALNRRESELDELLRSAEVQRRLAEIAAASTESGQDGAGAGGEASQAETEARLAFERLQKAYENMEPESAALALAELAEIDKQAVLQLLVGWKPRTSGAILDALTQSNPALAADLSYRIWKRGGKNGAEAASSGR